MTQILAILLIMMIIIIVNNYYVLLECICALGIFLITLILNDLIHNRELFRKGVRCFGAEKYKQDDFSPPICFK